MMKFLVILSLLASAVAFATPVSKKKSSLYQVDAKKKKKKGCSCGKKLYHHTRY